MKDTKLVSLMKYLSADDLRQIRKMLISPFYTTNTNLLALFKLLRTYHPAYESRKLEKRVIFRKLFPKHDYSDIKLRNLNSDLVRIIEDYLIFKEIRSDDFERRKKLAKIYKNSGHTDWFERELKKLIEELNKLPYRDQIYYRHMLDLRIMQLNYYEGRKMDHRYDLLKDWGNMLDHYYKLSKARNHMAIRSLNKLIKPTDSHTEEVETANNLQLELYQQLDELYRTEDADLLMKIKKTFEENIHLIRSDYQKELLSLLTNLAIKKMSIDDKKYNKVVLELYKLGLKHRVIFNSGQITDTAFFNIVVCASKAKEFDWTFHFIEAYEKNLSPVTKEDIKTISLSTYFFHKKEFSKAVEMMTTHRFRHLQMKYISRPHLIRCCYELYLLDSSYYEVLIAQIDSNERFIRRIENLPEDKLKSGLHFLSFIKKLATMRLTGKLRPTQQQYMLEELARQQITLSRSWLLEIIER